VNYARQLTGETNALLLTLDLSSYFDTIPHHELMQSVARRVSPLRLRGASAFVFVNGAWLLISFAVLFFHCHLQPPFYSARTAPSHEAGG
jgi:hypothetical protein